MIVLGLKSLFGFQHTLILKIFGGNRPNNNNLEHFLILLHTECVMDLDKLREMIIFESLLTTFEASYILEAAGGVVKIGKSLKSNQHNQV